MIAKERKSHPIPVCLSVVTHERRLVFVGVAFATEKRLAAAVRPSEQMFPTAQRDPLARGAHAQLASQELTPTLSAQMCCPSRANSCKPRPIAPRPPESRPGRTGHFLANPEIKSVSSFTCCSPYPSSSLSVFLSFCLSFIRFRGQIFSSC